MQNRQNSIPNTIRFRWWDSNHTASKCLAYIFHRFRNLQPAKWEWSPKLVITTHNNTTRFNLTTTYQLRHSTQNLTQWARYPWACGNFNGKTHRTHSNRTTTHSLYCSKSITRSIGTTHKLDWYNWSNHNSKLEAPSNPFNSDINLQANA